MLETSARLLRLLSVLQARRDWTGRDLADRLEVTERTVRRDVDRLRLLGYPVDARPGPGGGYRLGAGAGLPPLLLDDDEAVAIAVSLSSAATSGLTGLEETAVRALAKLEHVLPARLRHRVRTVQAAVVAAPGGGPATDVDVLLAVATAVRDRQQLRADYRRHDGTQSRRVLEPHRVVHVGRRWYVVAWDVDRAAWRTFRLDRLAPRTPSGPAFAPRDAPEPDLAAYVVEGTTSRAYRHRCRVTVHAPEQVVREHVPASVGVVRVLGDGACEVTTGGQSLDEMALWLGLVGAELTVHEPAALRDHLGELGARLTRASAEPPP